MKDLEEFIEELRYNLDLEIKLGGECRIDINYVIDRLEGIYEGLEVEGFANV